MKCQGCAASDLCRDEVVYMARDGERRVLVCEGCRWCLASPGAFVYGWPPYPRVELVPAAAR